VDLSLTAALGVGFLLGVRHAMDADHVAAISTFVVQHRSVARSCLLGTFWGAGHTVALLMAGTATLLLGLTVSPAVERGLEVAVACMLILLGGRVLGQAFAAVLLHRHEHAHGDRPHAHVDGQPGHTHSHLLRLGRRPFLVGLLHGLAGSAALTLLVLSTLSRPVEGLLYIAVFGVGSTAGMLVLTALIAAPLACTPARWRAVTRVVEATAGTASMGLGVWLAHSLT